jgi:hypothetical protein
VTYDELLAIAGRLEGRTLETITGRRFRVGVFRDHAFFTPESTGNGQTDGRAAHERFIERFNDIGSPRPGDYGKVTRNASYLLALIAAADTKET